MIRTTATLFFCACCASMVTQASASTVLVNISGSVEGNPESQDQSIAVDIVDGTFSRALSDDPTRELDAAPGESTSPIWDLTEFSVSGATNPFVTLSFTIVNTSSSDADLELAALVPLTSTFGPLNSAFGEIEMTLVDVAGTAGEATLIPFATDPTYRAIVGGSIVGVDIVGGTDVFSFLPLPPFPLDPEVLEVTGTPGGIASTAFDDTDLIGPVSGSIAIEFNATLSAGDALQVDAIFQITPVPEPASALLVGIAGMAFVPRRRR